MSNDQIEIKPSESWSDDQWYKDQDKRNLIKMMVGLLLMKEKQWNNN